MKFSIKLGVVVVVLVIGVMVNGSLLPNRPFHGDSQTALAFTKTEPYDFGFLEFSEHGNLFHRHIFEQLLEEIAAVQKAGPTAIVVFVHGWHHNADSVDSNVLAFKDLLAEMAKTDVGPFREHRVIGVYIGWRGSSFSVPLLKHLTFWDRKTVASEVGRGGVTETLITLERVNRCGTRQGPCEGERFRDNRIMVLGHSFGGAIVLSALSDVFVHRLVNANILPEQACEDEPGDRDGTFTQKRGAPCALVEPFGHGVVLLNPAIEANQVLPLKEIMASFRYPDSQDVLMHVLSSEGDLATRLGFPIGQWVNNLTWHETDIVQTYDYERETSMNLVHPEDALTETTVGNYAPFRTGWIGGEGEFQRCWRRDERTFCRPGDTTQRIPIGANEPIQFYLTDRHFIKDHGDVFNCLVRSYILAIAAEAVSARSSEYFTFGQHYQSLRAQCPD